MTEKPLSERIRDRAKKAQRKGKAGDAIKLHMLASEAKTIKDKKE